MHLPNIYNVNTWDLLEYDVKTDRATNVYCRAPGNYFYY